MTNKTKIDWATMSWNPVTGCRHGCPYCYAARTANRFNGHREDPIPLAEGIHILKEKPKAMPYPYGFEPTLHLYRLDQPRRQDTPQTVFVCSMADLFGEWVPTNWIWDVMDACKDAPQHRYLFLTKAPERYKKLEDAFALPHRENFWYGMTVTDQSFLDRIPALRKDTNTFWSMEPLLGPVDLNQMDKPGLPGWVIMGAETGSRADKVVPERIWVDQIAAFCEGNEIPVFYKDNLRAYFPDLPASTFPWEE